MKHPFTKTYIAMARAAREIQAMKSRDLNEWDKGEAGIWLVDLEPGGCDEFAQFYAAQTEPPIDWIPRLDQLLGMLGRPKYFIMYDEQQQKRDWFDSYGKTGEDWHELALAVVMRKKHGKTWDGKGWVRAS